MEAKARAHVRRFLVGRGVYGKVVNDGGGQERQLAERYMGWSDAIVRFPRTSAMLTGISEDWRRHAEREDAEAEKSKLKM